MKIVFFLVALLGVMLTHAQELIEFNYKKDYPILLKESKNKKGPYAYETLLKRFLHADTSLSPKEILVLQIAFTENENYRPYQEMDREKIIWKLNDADKFSEALKHCDTILTKNPFNLLANREKAYALSKLEKDSADHYFRRFEMLINANLSTGTGFSIDSSWFVLGPADGQLIITTVFSAKVCYMGSGNDAHGHFHDILGMKLDDMNYCANLYFNIHHAANRMFTTEDKKQMEKLLRKNNKAEKKRKDKPVIHTTNE